MKIKHLEYLILLFPFIYGLVFHLHPFLTLLIIGLRACVEELIYRVGLLHWFPKWTNLKLPWCFLLQAIVFTTDHIKEGIQWCHIIEIFGFGCVLGAIYLKGGFASATFIHFLFNVMVL